jgi:4-amino-4-deoxy-L-arabinose transferase-like glycosyltransferase
MSKKGKRRRNAQEAGPPGRTRTEEVPAAPSPRRRAAFEAAVLAAILLLAAAYRARFLDVPLDRDEGEYAYAGRLLQEGTPPYEAAYNMKMPGTYGAYAVALTLFGPTERGIRFALLLVNAATTVLVFFLGRRLFGPTAALAAAGAFALLALGTPVRGIFAKAEHFVLLAAVAGTLLLLRAEASSGGRRLAGLAASGILLGSAFVLKQHGALFALFGIAYVATLELRRRPAEWIGAVARVVTIAAAAVVPLAATAAWLARAGVFDSFRFWTFTYAFEYATAIPLGTGLGFLFERLGDLARSYFPIAMLAVLGLGVLLAKRRGEGSTRFTFAFLAFSFLAVCPGLYFRPHYFVMLLPAAALLAGIGFEAIVAAARRSGGASRVRAAAAAIVLVCLAQTLYRERQLLAAPDPGRVARLVYFANPFPEAPEIGRYLREHTDPGDRIAVVGSEPQIYFYADRRGATGFLYTYALVEEHPHARSMQEQMIREIEEGRPRYLVFVMIPESWLARPGSEEEIFDWFRSYAEANYELVGIVDIPERGETVFRWDDEAKGYAPRSPRWITILRRKGGS